MPQKTYSTSLLELQSLHKVTQFVKNCGKDHFYVNPVQTSRQCQEDVFSLTIGFNEGPLACKCNPTGSKSTFCEQFGGQCPCVPNVVGRICNRCRLGYSGFPRCKREYFKFLLFFFIVDAAIKVPKLWTYLHGCHVGSQGTNLLFCPIDSRFWIYQLQGCGKKSNVSHQNGRHVSKIYGPSVDHSNHRKWNEPFTACINTAFRKQLARKTV